MKFIARQPILTRRRDVFAYELLFRSESQNSFDGVNLEQAFRVDARYLIHDRSAEAHRGTFVNCPRDFLLHDYISLFSRDLVVVELLENIEPDAEVVKACQRLKRDGYLLALDDRASAMRRGAPISA